MPVRLCIYAGYILETFSRRGPAEQESEREREKERERERENPRPLSFSFDIWNWSDSTTNRRKGFSITFCSRVPFPFLLILFFSRRLMFIGDRVFRTLHFTFSFRGDATHTSPDTLN